jgi:hypothetical protein
MTIEVLLLTWGLMSCRQAKTTELCTYIFSLEISVHYLIQMSCTSSSGKIYILPKWRLASHLMDGSAAFQAVLEQCFSC